MKMYDDTLGEFINLFKRHKKSPIASEIGGLFCCFASYALDDENLYDNDGRLAIKTKEDYIAMVVFLSLAIENGCDLDDFCYEMMEFLGKFKIKELKPHEEKIKEYLKEHPRFTTHGDNERMLKGVIANSADEKQNERLEEAKLIARARRKKSTLCPEMRRSWITYQDYVENFDDQFKEHPGYSLEPYESIEEREIYESEDRLLRYEFDSMLCFLAMAYVEIKYDGMSERLLAKMDDELYFWNLGVGEEMLFEEEKGLVYEHLKIVDEYVTKNFKGETRRKILDGMK